MKILLEVSPADVVRLLMVADLLRELGDAAEVPRDTLSDAREWAEGLASRIQREAHFESRRITP